MALSSSEIKKNIIHVILDFSINLDQHRRSGAYSNTQLSEMINMALEINNLINTLDLSINQIDDLVYRQGLVRPRANTTDFKSIKRILELSFRFKADINSISIEIGENITSTNQLLQAGLDYLFNNLKRKDFRVVTQVQSPSPAQATIPKPKKTRAANPNTVQQPRKGLGCFAPLLFFAILGWGGMMIYDNFFSGSLKTQSLISEYRSDAKLTSVANTKDNKYLRIYGSGSLGSVINDLQSFFIAKYPETHLEFRSMDSTEAITTLINGQTDIAASSKIPTVVERRQSQAKKRLLAEHRIALDAVVVIVNPANPIEKLSLEELKDIYSNDAANWSSYGASPGLISRYSLSQNSGTFAFFKDRVLYTAQASQKVQFIYEMDKLLTTVESDHNAIAFVALGAIRNHKVKVIKLSTIFDEKGVSPLLDSGEINMDAVRRGEYPLTRYLYLITAGGLTESQARLIDFMKSSEVQQVLYKYGLVSVY